MMINLIHSVSFALAASVFVGVSATPGSHEPSPDCNDKNPFSLTDERDGSESAFPQVRHQFRDDSQYQYEEPPPDGYYYEPGQPPPEPQQPKRPGSYFDPFAQTLLQNAGSEGKLEPKKLQVVNKRVSVEKLFIAYFPVSYFVDAHYPTAPKVREFIGGAINDDAFQDTCVIRMSHGLNYAGVMIPESSTALRTVKGRSFENHPPLNYALRTNEIERWLTKIWGPPEIMISKPVRTEMTDHSLNGLRGVILINFPPYAHMDIWNGAHYTSPGETRPDMDYFFRADWIKLWVLPTAPAS